MNSFEVKRGHGKTLENGGLKSIMEEEFGDVMKMVIYFQHLLKL